jgi:hypothetical protein
MHTDDVVFVGPAGHEALDVGLLKCFVKREFGVVR